MKIIITTTAPSIDAELDQRFGRAAYLLQVDPETLNWKAHPNPGANAPGGAGIQAAQAVSEQKADAVISGDFGPHAFDALRAANVPMYLFGTSQTAREAAARFQAGELQRVGAATRGDCHSESGH